MDASYKKPPLKNMETISVFSFPKVKRSRFFIQKYLSTILFCQDIWQNRIVLLKFCKLKKEKKKKKSIARCTIKNAHHTLKSYKIYYAFIKTKLQQLPIASRNLTMLIKNQYLRNLKCLSFEWLCINRRSC